MNVTAEGTIRFWLHDRHPDWTTDERDYNFGTKHPQGLVVTALKHSDKTVEILLVGLDGRPFSLRERIPQCEERGLHVGITWTKSEVVLRLNGKARQTLPRADSPQQKDS
jgi:hypothetical protein